MTNPFTLAFGKKPVQYISRIFQENRIAEAFGNEVASEQVFMITGQRGSGKTVLLSNIAMQLVEDDAWIVTELNSTRDLLQSLAANLYANSMMHPLFVKAKFDFSALGLGVSMEGAPPVTDVEAAIAKMLGEVKRVKKRVLITIDEVVVNENIRVFASAFQIFMRQEYPVYLLMTGLFDNIYDLQNDRSLTFLYRAPKILLEPLNHAAIQQQYMDVFHISQEQASYMASLTKGYSFAFQVLGYLYWREKGQRSIDDILPEFDQYLSEYVYEKIWSELSRLDKSILYHMARQGETNVKAIRHATNMTSEKFSVYRERLKRKGIIDTSEYGHIKFLLPRFDAFVEVQRRIEGES